MMARIATVTADAFYGCHFRQWPEIRIPWNSITLLLFCYFAIILFVYITIYKRQQHVCIQCMEGCCHAKKLQSNNPQKWIM